MLKAPQNSQIFGDSDIKYKNSTFSGYKKTQVYQQLKKSILKSEIDNTFFKTCIWIMRGATSNLINRWSGYNQLLYILY